ncbi:hypothetical protein B0H13DRAFT_1970980 [Mycena leptocephala]|nr:hypothetical protein B0H13DRAFT_1970980 [Mycena leptocephala]
MMYKDVRSLIKSRRTKTYWHSLDGHWQRYPPLFFLFAASHYSLASTLFKATAMPYPHRSTEPADARAALMANLSSQPTPYCRPARPKRNLIGECRKTRQLPSLGWGAFLKDETLRTPQGKIVRMAQGPCPSRALVFSLPCTRQPLSEECLSALRQKLSIEEGSSWGCQSCRGDDSAHDCTMSFPTDSPCTGMEGVKRRRGWELTQGSCDDCEMPSRETSDYSPFELRIESTVPPGGHESGGMGDQITVKAADELFLMFIDETCMEVEGN